MVPASAVVVWQLRGFVEDVHCYFLKSSGVFTLVVQRAGEQLLCEEFDGLAPLMTRAADLRCSLVRVGFRSPAPAEDVLAQPVLDNLLWHFVREGTASLYCGPQA